MTEQRKSLGRHAEQMAKSRLQKQGYRILEENYCCPLGELDLVALDREVLAFIEVRSRMGSGNPEASVNRAKQRQIIKTAHYYLAQRKWEGDCRFDVVAVQISPEGKCERMEVIKDAFDVEGMETFD
ncbi:MAG: YraN family protein [candidate division NC10 bacterium]|nr:YraN family protein [candidate division NC10 bacterium]